jgi:hypothetical protein
MPQPAWRNTAAKTRDATQAQRPACAAMPVLQTLARSHSVDAVSEPQNLDAQQHIDPGAV